MKSILLTGAHGFLGQNLINQFLQHSEYELLTPSKTELNLLNQDNVRDYLYVNLPNIIIHAAGRVGGLPFNKANPGLLAYENLAMGVNLIEYSRRYVELFQVKNFKLILISTTCGYPSTPKTFPFTEEEFFDGEPEFTNAPYGWSKRMLVKLGQAYREQYGLNIISLVPTNLVGEYDHFDERSHVVPALIKKFDDAIKNGSKFVQLLGDGSASRDLLYVGDCARAIYLAMESYNESHILNIGSGYEITIKDLATLISKLMGFNGEIRFEDSSSNNGQQRRVLDISKAKKYLGFSPNFTLEEALKRTINWYRGGISCQK